MFDDIQADMADKFDKAQTNLKRSFTKIRTGRANANLLEGVMVQYYGVPTPIQQVATIKTPEPRLLTIAPWEKSLLQEIEKAIHKADLGLTPNSDGTLIRLPIPALSGERRQELARQAKKLAEEARISVRAARRDANEMLKDLQKEGDITEDDLHRDMAIVQTLTDAAIELVDQTLADKEGEILEV